MKLVAIIAFILWFVTPVKAETVIIPIQDLLLEIPNYEAPRMNINSALNGQYSITDIKKQKRENKKFQQKLIDMAYEIHPEATSIRIWNGNFIIKFA
jgi:hypothetical protein